MRRRPWGEQVAEVVAMPSSERPRMVAAAVRAAAVTARAAVSEAAVRQVEAVKRVQVAKQAAGNLVDLPAGSHLPARAVEAKPAVP